MYQISQCFKVSPTLAPARVHISSYRLERVLLHNCHQSTGHSHPTPGDQSSQFTGLPASSLVPLPSIYHKAAAVLQLNCKSTYALPPLRTLGRLPTPLRVQSNLCLGLASLPGDSYFSHAAPTF